MDILVLKLKIYILKINSLTNTQTTLNDSKKI